MVYRVNRKVYDEDIIFLRKLGYSTREISNVYGMHYAGVWNRAKKLSNLGYIEMSNAENGFKRKGKESDNRNAEIIHAYLTKYGHITREEAVAVGGNGMYAALLNLERERIIYSITYSLNQTNRSHRKFASCTIFNGDVLDKKYYFADRTSLLRFTCKVINFIPKTTNNIVRQYIYENFSKAESLALMNMIEHRNIN